MKKFLIVLATLALLPAALVLAQVASDESTQVAWDEVTTDVQGNPETVASYQLVVTQMGAFPDGSEAIHEVSGSTLVADIGQHMLNQQLPVGNYDVFCRAVDAANNVSDWSAPVSLSWPDKIAPAAPSNFRIITTQ